MTERTEDDIWREVLRTRIAMNRMTRQPQIACITLDEQEPAPQHYRDICTGNVDLMATSVYCEDGTGCGGHPICRPCYDLARTEGLVR